MSQSVSQLNVCHNIFDAKNLNQLCSSLNNSSINSQDEYGWTPLMYAARRNDIIACRFLVGEGADIELRDKRNRSVIFFAIEENYEGLCKFFIEKKANLHVTDLNGDTPSKFAIRLGHTHLVELLKV